MKPRSLSRRHVLAGAAWIKALHGAPDPLAGRSIFVVPNFHPASCGWLTNFSKERVYCANSYFDHLDRVRDDPTYAFALSEVNNLIAMMNFRPDRMQELRARIRERRVELVNGFFLESTINLSGGEALVRLGVLGMRWQEEIFGVRPRFAWTIDVCGTHEQMAQIAAGLGLEAMVYTRKNPTGCALHWAESPDGSRILAISPGHYSEFRPVMSARKLLTPREMETLKKQIAAKLEITPEGAPILILAGSGDYSLAPLLKEYPQAFLAQWKQYAPDTELRFVTPGRYLDAVLPLVKTGKLKIPVMRGGTAYDFLSFWIQNPRVKTWFRKNEHLLQAAEMLAAAASLETHFDYPSETFYHAWLQTCLNMDRNTLWGAAGGMVFEHDKSWDVRDRLEWVENHSVAILSSAGKALLQPGEGLGFFNPLNWKRSDPLLLRAPVGSETSSQTLPDGRCVAQIELPPCGIRAVDGHITPAASKPISLPPVIENRYYQLRIDPKTGAITSLKLRRTGREILAGPANVIVAERPVAQRGDPGDHMALRPDRVRLHSTNQASHTINVWTGPLVTVIEAVGVFFGGGICRRIIRLHQNYPRIDFEAELNDIPDRTVVVAEFPLASPIEAVRRGIPYGFSHGAWEKPSANLHGWTEGIVPAVRWSHYSLAEGGGVAILDRGLSGRELHGRTPVLFLLNATDKYHGYPNPWLSGKGRHKLEYALVAHEGSWREARIPQLAWEYNCPPAVFPGCASAPARSFLETSENVIVEAMRRESNDLEIRFAECFGESGTAELRVHLPHRGAKLAGLNGQNPKPLSGGPSYRIPLQPQQIITARFSLAGAVRSVKPLTQWDELVPAHKRPLLHEYTNDKGHPPRGAQP